MAGLVTREISPAKRRAILIELTPAGRDVLAAVARARAGAYGAVTTAWTATTGQPYGAAACATARDDEGDLDIGGGGGTPLLRG